MVSFHFAVNNTNKRCIRKILPKHLQQDSILSSSNCSEKKIAVSAATGGLTTNPTTAVSNLKTHVHRLIFKMVFPLLDFSGTPSDASE